MLVGKDAFWPTLGHGDHYSYGHPLRTSSDRLYGAVALLCALMRCRARRYEYEYEYEDEDEDEDEDGGAGQSPMTESFGYCRFRLSLCPRKLPLQGSRWFAQAVEGRSCSVWPLVAAVLPAVRAGMRSRVQVWNSGVCAIICEHAESCVCALWTPSEHVVLAFSATKSNM